MGEGFLILETAGIELAPEFLLQGAKFILGELILRYTSLELTTKEKLMFGACSL